MCVRRFLKPQLVLGVLVAGVLFPAFGQRGTTMSSVVNQNVVLPTDGPLVYINALKGKGTVSLQKLGAGADTGLQKNIQPWVKTNDSPKSESRGFYYMYQVHQTFSDTGVYKVQFVFTGLDEFDKSPKRFESSWMVHVTYPTLSMGLHLDSAYYFGATAFINFAVREFTDPTLYRYVITSSRGDTVDQNHGSFVPLDKVLRNVSYAKEGLSFVVQGFYNDSLFTFTNPSSRLVERSVWRFRVKAPELELVTPWESATFFGKTRKAFDMHQRVDWGPLQFGFILNADQGDAWLHVRPDPPVGSVHVRSDPADFLPQSENQRFRVIAGADVPWYILELKPTVEFFQTVPPGGTRPVKLTIQIKTQFDESPRSYVVYGNVY